MNSSCLVSLTCRRSSPSHGYTLIELVAAMAASSLLLVGLASTVAISTHFVEPTDQSGQQSRDRMIVDRLSHDLRYATSINATGPESLVVERVDLANTSQKLVYQTSATGLTRQVNGGALIQLDQASPRISHFVDGYTAATPPSLVLRPRIRDVSIASTDSSLSSSIQIDLPAGARQGDLLVLVIAYRNSLFVIPPSNGWELSSAKIGTSIVMTVYRQVMSSSTFSTQTLSYFPGGDVAAGILAIEHSDLASPLGWSGTASGTSSIGNPMTFPQPLENASTHEDTSLNLQLFASAGGPTPQTSLGIASFSDCVNLIGSSGTSGECSLGIAFRTGPMPTLVTSPRVLHQQSVNWVTIGLEFEGADE